MYQNMQSISKGPTPTRDHLLIGTSQQHRRLHVIDEPTPV